MRINLTKSGETPSYKGLNRAINEVIDGYRGGSDNLEIVLDKGVYDMSLDEAVNKVVYMTNTVSEKEMAIPNRQIGLYLENRENIVLNGNGATLLYEGRMTEVMLSNCKNITLKNFNFDFALPTVAEFEIINVEGSQVTLRPYADTTCQLISNKLVFDALAGITARVVVQECDIANKLTRRVDAMSWYGDIFARQTSAKLNQDGSYTISIIGHLFKAGYIYQVCKITRDACGTFIDNCSDIKLIDNQYYFMHGMGILAQMSKNITIEKCKMTPNTHKGRTTATFADMIHCAMCSGDIIVRDCKFDGSRDDIINVHGNHYIISKIKGNIVEVKYCHPQTYGFMGFKEGDKIEVIHAKSLVPIETAQVKSAEMVSKRTIRLELEIPLSKARGGMAIENVDRCANLLVEGCEGSNIPTRGILVTTRGKVVIRKNIFRKMYMSAILMSDDAKGWYESGYCRDITIEDNTFENCCDWVIDILPEAHSILKKPMVHENITIRNNTIIHPSGKIMRARRTRNLNFYDNNVSGGDNYEFDVKDCLNVNLGIEKLCNRQ